MGTSLISVGKGSSALLVVLLCVLSVVTLADEQAADLFEPEVEWKDILPGQHLPGGLDIRMNLSTGHKEARLLPGGQQRTDDSATAVALSPTPSALEKQNDLRVHASENDTESGEEAAPVPHMGPEGLTMSQMMQWAIAHSDTELLHNMTEPGKVEQRYTAEQIQEYAKYFMTDEFNSMQTFLRGIANTTLPDDERVYAAEDLEDTLYQIDNANDFAKNGGLVVMVALLRDPSTPRPLLLAVLRCIGTATQNNIEVQKMAVEADALPAIAATWQQAAAEVSKEGSVESAAAYQVLSECVYALSAVVRGGNRAGERELMVAGTVDRLAATVAEGGNARLVGKVLAFIADLFAVSPIDLPAGGTWFQSAVNERALCTRMVTLLRGEGPDPVLVEKILLAAEAMVHAHAGDFLDDGLAGAVAGLHTRYAAEQKAGGDRAPFLVDLGHLADRVLTQAQENARGGQAS